MLKSLQGLSYVETLAERDGDAYSYMIESEYGVDIRKKLFYALAERSWPMIGMEALGMSLEDIFISVVDQSESKKLGSASARVTRRSRTKEKAAVEKEVGESLYADAQRQREETPPAEDDE